MRFIMLMIPQVFKENADPDFMPSADIVEQMTTFNEALANSGALIALDGLSPPAMGARVSFAGGKPAVANGPFAEVNEHVGGYWLIRVASRDEAIAWAARVPARDGDVIEVRQVFDLEDYPEDVQKAAASDAVRKAIS